MGNLFYICNNGVNTRWNNSDLWNIQLVGEVDRYITVKVLLHGIMQLFVSRSLSVYTLNKVACFMQFVYKLFPPKWRILTMKTLSSLFVICHLLLEFSYTEGTVSEDCGLDLGLVWVGYIPWFCLLFIQMEETLHLFLWPNNITTLFPFPAMFYLPCHGFYLLMVL